MHATSPIHQSFDDERLLSSNRVEPLRRSRLILTSRRRRSTPGSNKIASTEARSPVARPKSRRSYERLADGYVSSKTKSRFCDAPTNCSARTPRAQKDQKDSPGHRRPRRGRVQRETVLSSARRLESGLLHLPQSPTGSNQDASRVAHRVDQRCPRRESRYLRVSSGARRADEGTRRVGQRAPRRGSYAKRPALPGFLARRRRNGSRASPQLTI